MMPTGSADARAVTADARKPITHARDGIADARHITADARGALAAQRQGDR